MAEKYSSSLQMLAEMPAVSDVELKGLLHIFSQSTESTAKDNKKFAYLCNVLKEVNPRFNQEVYSDLPEANVLANVVSAIYAPLIHGFSFSLLKNIESGALPKVISAPPRDTIPLTVSLEAISKDLGK